MTGRSPLPARRQSPGAETSKAVWHPSRRQEAKRQERRPPAGLQDGQTVRPDAHTPSPLASRHPVRSPLPPPKIHLRPLSLFYDSLCLTTSVRRSTPPSLLTTRIVHPLPRFTRPVAFPLFAEFPPSIRGSPVPDFWKRPPSLTPYHDFPILPFSIRRPPKLRLPPPPSASAPVLFPETPIIFSRPPFLAP